MKLIIIPYSQAFLNCYPKLLNWSGIYPKKLKIWSYKVKTKMCTLLFEVFWSVSVSFYGQMDKSLRRVKSCSAIQTIQTLSTLVLNPSSTVYPLQPNSAWFDDICSAKMIEIYILHSHWFSAVTSPSQQELSLTLWPTLSCNNPRCANEL